VRLVAEFLLHFLCFFLHMLSSLVVHGVFLSLSIDSNLHADARASGILDSVIVLWRRSLLPAIASHFTNDFAVIPWLFLAIAQHYK